MTREELIKNLKYTMKKHEHDRVATFDTNISLMCKDMLDYLEQEPQDGDRAISLNAVLDALEMSCLKSEIDDLTYQRIKELPSVTSQRQTGHCKDCKHFQKLPYHAGTLGKCIHHTGFCPKGDWYCADFEIVEL